MAAPEKATFSGIWPEVGVADALAARAAPTALTVVVTLDVAVFAGEEPSVTVRVAVNVPAEM